MVQDQPRIKVDGACVTKSKSVILSQYTKNSRVY